MTVPAAYLGIIVIWSTTPLAIQWSSEGVGFLFGVTVRMLIALVVCLFLLRVLKISMRWQGKEGMTYLASSLGIYFAMISVYWGAQFIPSGLISVLYGLLPIATAVISAIWFRESLYQPARIFSLVLGVLGLYVIFNPTFDLDGKNNLLLGALGVLISVVIHAISMVWIKKIAADEVNPLAMTAGGLVIATPLYVLTWGVADAQWPDSVLPTVMYSIVYLSVIGSVVGFVLYYYVLKKLAAAVVSLITLVTPVCALVLGYWVNNERLEAYMIFGVILIMLALITHQCSLLFGRKKLGVND